VSETNEEKCPHGLISFIFCHKCWIDKHGEPEPFEQWSKRVAVNKIALASKEESAEIWAEAEQWIAKGPSRGRYKNFRYDAKSVIAEYIANQRGLTLLWPKS
jgi:hypothetical protein